MPKCKGSIKTSDTCPYCYIDIETGLLIPCNNHKISIPKPRKKKDISEKLPLEFKNLFGEVVK